MFNGLAVFDGFFYSGHMYTFGLISNIFTMLGEVLRGILCVYDLWVQLRIGVGRR